MRAIMFLLLGSLSIGVEAGVFVGIGVMFIAVSVMLGVEMSVANQLRKKFPPNT